MKRLKFNLSNLPSNKQDGISMVVTIVVLLALTTLALAATNTNQSQALMVRNAQLRLEAFNASYAEIDAQIDFVNRNNFVVNNPPAYFLALRNGAVGTAIDDKNSAVKLPRYAPAEINDIEQEVTQTNKGNCRLLGEQVGKGKEKKECTQFQIDADSTVVDTTIESQQSQVYEYVDLVET